MGCTSLEVRQAGRVAVFASGGPPALTAGRALTVWNPDPVGLLLVAAGAVGYLAAVRRLQRIGGRWPAGRTVLFVLPGLGSVLLATAGWIGSYAHVLLWAYTLQVIMLLLVAPIFLLLGRPGRLLSAAWPAGHAGQQRGGRGWRWLRPVTSPVIGPALVPVVLGVVLFTSLLGWSLRHQPVYLALHVPLLAVGLLIAAPLAGADGAMTSLSVAAATFVGFLELLLDAVPGMVLRLKTHLLAPGWFVRVHRPWGPTPLGDQRIAGALLWSLGEALELPFLALLVVRWIRADEREAYQIDHALDAQAAARRAAPAHPAGGIAGGGGAPERLPPWWETDPSVFGEARARHYRRP